MTSNVFRDRNEVHVSGFVVTNCKSNFESRDGTKI